MNLSPEEKAIGKENFYATIGMTRRDFLKGGIAAGAVSGAGLGAMYFHYSKSIESPLRVGFIGTGDEGNVLLGAITPSFLQVVAIADIRPYNVYRAFHGDHSSENALKVRCGLMSKYGWKTEDEARKHVKVYTDYQDLLKDQDIEAVVIALPLFLHDVVAIEAMKAGKHVLTEKLMAHSVRQCKEMSRVAKHTNKLLVTGHQRHYSVLYDNAVDTIKRGMIGDIHHIRAQWHRDNQPGTDSWQLPLPDDKMADTIKKLEKSLAGKTGLDAEAQAKKLEIFKKQYEDRAVDAGKYGYEARTLPDGKERTALEELIRWRLWNRTGGGLMAELGSHQLDASGIFISAMQEGGEKALPLTVNAMGGRHIFPMDRDCEDHVYCIYEFPGKNYKQDKNNIVGVTYSSINGNGFGGYGEIVMGTKGTLILEREQEVMLYKGSSVGTSVTVKAGDKGAPTLDTTSSGGGEAAAVGKAALDTGPISRGYTEEMEHWAWCIRNPDPANIPRCHPKIALGDAVIALVTNIAIREKRRIEFDPAWFDIDSDETPEGVKPNVPVDA